MAWQVVTATVAAVVLGTGVAGDEVLTKHLITGTRCLDGSPAGYYYRPANTTRGATTWVIYLEGGGLCYDASSCYSRAKTTLGSSLEWVPTRAGTASYSFDSTSNPDFWDAHHVFVPYCSGDLHTGTVNKTSLATFGLYFSGHNNLVSIVSELVLQRSLRNAERVLLTGDSAGGMGTFYNVDWLRDELTWATVKGAPVGGWFFSGMAEDQPLAQWAPPSTYPDWTKNKTGTTQALVGYLVQLYHVYLHPNCRETFRFHCGSVHVMYNYIKAPLFVLQNMYDTNQISAELFMPGCSADDCTDEQKGFVAYFGRSFRKSTKQVIDNAGKKSDGLFLPSCYAHTEGINIQGKTNINGFLPTELVGNWFFEREGRTPNKVVDDCREELPCNPSCGSMIPEPRPGPETKCETELNTLCSRTTGCYACAMENLPQLLDALCTIEEITELCRAPPS